MSINEKIQNLKKFVALEWFYYVPGYCGQDAATYHATEELIPLILKPLNVAEYFPSFIICNLCCCKTSLK
jgi:hypothetical protein